jgi:hypothetical protein
MTVLIRLGSSPYTMYIFNLLVWLPLSFAATTAGPLAPISIHSLQAYSTARPCAAGCLVFNGIWQCGVNGGYHDLGKDLGCNCSPVNGCWCSTGLQSSATSYISSCVSSACSKVGNVDGDIKSMLDLYGNYCATANVEVSSVPAQTAATTTTPGVATTRATTKATGSTNLIVTQAPSESTAQPGNEQKEEDEGLSKSDVIALATGLGVGVPSLIVAVVALYIQLRRKKPSATSSPTTSDIKPVESQTNFFPQPHPEPSNVYELGDRGGRGRLWR